MRTRRLVVAAVMVLLLALGAWVASGTWPGERGGGVASDEVVEQDPDGTSLASSLGEPLDDFTNVTAAGMVQVDGRPKLYTTVSGHPGHFQVVDVTTDTVEVDLPFLDAGSHRSGAMTVGADGAVYIGVQGGQLYRWRPGTSRLEPLGHPTATSRNVYSLKTGPDGRIWGGTYPGGELFSYDPVLGRVTNHGTLAPGRTYVRSLAVDDAFVYAAVGSREPVLVRVSTDDPADRVQIPPPVRLRDGLITDLEVYGRYLSMSIPTGTTTDGVPHRAQRYLYDLRTRSVDVPAAVSDQAPTGPGPDGEFYYTSGGCLRSVSPATGATRCVSGADLPRARIRFMYAGTLAGREGWWFVSFHPRLGITAIDVQTRRRVELPVTLASVALRMKSLGVGPEDRLYAGGYGGASLAVVDPDSGQSEQYPLDSTQPRSIGEVEGMARQGRYEFLGTYSRARIFRYDASLPWVDGQNPTLLVDLSSRGQDRPQAWATSGSVTYFGTVPGYGRRGGVLGVIRTPTAAPRIIESPVADQSIVALAARGSIVYGGTSRWGGLGSGPDPGSAVVFAYDTEANRLLWTMAPSGGSQSVGAVTLGADGTLWAVSGQTLYRLDAASGGTLGEVRLGAGTQPEEPTYRNASIVLQDDTVYVATSQAVLAVDPDTATVRTLAQGVTTYGLLTALDRVLYYPDGSRLMAIRRP